MPPDTGGSLSHQLTPQIYTRPHRHTHAHAAAQTSRRVFPFLCLSLGLNFVQPHMLCVRARVGGGGADRDEGWHDANIYLWGLGQGRPPQPPWERPQLSLCSQGDSPGGGKHRSPFSGLKGLVPDPPLGACERKNGQSRTPEGAWNSGPPQPPISSLATPLFPCGGSISGGGAIPPPPSQSLLSLLWAERGGQQRYLFISFIYLIFFFFGVESDRWRRVPGEPALPQCRRMPITVSHVIAAARDVPSPYGLA